MRLRHYVLAMLLVISSTLSASAQTCPTFPTRGEQIIDQLVAKHPALAQGDDVQRRLLTRYIAEQMRYEFGNWSMKAADKTRPQSKDSLALPVNGGPAFCNWDWQNGTTRKRAIDRNTEGEYLDDQYLLPTTAVNHLGLIVTGPSVPTQPTLPPPTDAVIESLKVQVEILRSELQQAQATVAEAAAGLHALTAEVQAQRAALDSMNAVLIEQQGLVGALHARPVPTGCRVSLFGIRGNCEVE